MRDFWNRPLTRSLAAPSISGFKYVCDKIFRKGKIPRDCLRKQQIINDNSNNNDNNDSSNYQCVFAARHLLSFGSRHTKTFAPIKVTRGSGLFCFTCRFWLFGIIIYYYHDSVVRLAFALSVERPANQTLQAHQPDQPRPTPRHQPGMTALVGAETNLRRGGTDG